MARVMVLAMLLLVMAGAGGCAIPRTLGLHWKADGKEFHPENSREVGREINGFGGQEEFELVLKCPGGAQETAAAFETNLAVAGGMW